MSWTLALSIVVLLCSQTGLNWPVRYALPAIPFLFMAIAGRLRHACERRVWRYLLIIPLLPKLLRHCGVPRVCDILRERNRGRP